MQQRQLKPGDLEAARDLIAAHPGKCPLFLCLMRPGGEVVFIETHERYASSPSLGLQQAVDERFGEETYYGQSGRRPAPARTPRNGKKKQAGNGEDRPWVADP